jgi:flagellar capping protein FliD
MMTKGLQSLIDSYNDLIIRCAELSDKTLLARVLASVEETQTQISKGLLR